MVLNFWYMLSALAGMTALYEIGLTVRSSDLNSAVLPLPSMMVMMILMVPVSVGVKL